MNIISLQHDYLLVSLTRLSAPVKVVEKLVPDIKFVEGIEGILSEEPELIAAQIMTEEVLQATVVDEEIPTADMVDEETINGTMITEESIHGVLKDCE